MGKTPEDDNTSKNILEKLPAFADNFTQAITKLASYTVVFILIAFVRMRAIDNHQSWQVTINTVSFSFMGFMLILYMLDFYHNNTTIFESLKKNSWKGILESIFNLVLIVGFQLLACISIIYAIFSVS